MASALSTSASAAFFLERHHVEFLVDSPKNHPVGGKEDDVATAAVSSRRVMCLSVSGIFAVLYEDTAAITGLGRFWRLAAARGTGGQGQAGAGPGSSESVMVTLMRFLLRIGQGYLCSSV